MKNKNKILIFTLFLAVSFVNVGPALAYDASGSQKPPITLPQLDEGYFLSILNEIASEAGRYIGINGINGGGFIFNQLPNIVSEVLINTLDVVKNSIIQLIEMARGYNPAK